jgi:hypothetical protein
MKIVWKEWKTEPCMGHGVHFHDRRRPRDRNLVAWLEDFYWLHENPEVVTILCIPPDIITTVSMLTATKRIISTYVKKKKLIIGSISRYIEAWPNT